MPVNIVTGAMKYKDTNGDYQDITGVKGATFTPAVSPEGILSWSNDSNLTNPDSVNIKGMVNNSVQIHETVTGPADIVTIQDGADGLPVTDLKVKIEPLQDLHGYDSPWPGGGGKNLFDESTLIHGSFVENPATITQNEKYRSAVLNLPAGTYTFSTTLQNCYVIRICYDNTIIGVATTEQSHTFTTTTDGIVGICFRNTSTTDITESFHTQIEAGSTATAYVPYENICPINGRTGINVKRTGKNLFDKNNAIILDAYLSTTQIVSSSTSKVIVVPIQPGCKYVISKVASQRFAVAESALESPTVGSNLSAYAVDHTATSITKTMSASAKTLLIWPYASNYDTLSFSDILDSIQVEFGDVASEYEAYSGNVYDISWQSEAGTVYGGELNAATGILTVNTVLFEDWANCYASSVNTEGTGRVFYRDLLSTNYKVTNDQISNCLIKYTVASWSGMPARSYNVYTARYIIICTENSDDTVQTMRQWISDNNIQLTVSLKEPITYQLTPSQITTLLGTNHIQSNTGNILSLTYSADPKMYVDQNSVSDVQVNGTSVVTNGVANVPIATNNTPGVIMASASYGFDVVNGFLSSHEAASFEIKAGERFHRAISTNLQHEAAFYGLAKIAGADEKNSSLTAGTYSENAKSKISDMLSAPVTVSGTTPSITALPGVRYICGECSTLSITVPESGIIDITFTSGSTATVLTVTPPTGMTMHWSNGFDPTSLDADTVYEINIMDGCYGVVGTWT